MAVYSRKSPDFTIWNQLGFTESHRNFHFLLKLQTHYCIFMKAVVNERILNEISSVVLKMNVLQIYLAIRETEGCNNQTAASELLEAYNTNQVDGDKLAISNSMRSRAKAGYILRPEKRNQVSNAVNIYFQKSGQKKDENQTLEQFLNVQLQSSELQRILNIYNLKKENPKPKDSIHVPVNLSPYSKEDLDLILGVWAQINYSCALDKEAPPKVRVALRHFHLIDGEIRSYCIGRTNNWEGRMQIINVNLHFTERMLGTRYGYGEIANYVFNKQPSYRHEELLHGFIQAVSHYDFRHMFSGVTVLKKMDSLSAKYKSDLPKFKVDSDSLRKFYCGHIEQHELESFSSHIPQLKAVVDNYLNDESGRLFHVIPM
jgi:hypothetical protein